MSRSSGGGADCSHEEAYATPHRGSTRKRGQVELTIGIDLGDVWSHYYTLNQQGEVIDRGRFRTTPKAIDKQAKNKSVVAVARKLAVLLHHLWTTQQPYVPFYQQAA